jgi:hypothetical protein
MRQLPLLRVRILLASAALVALVALLAACGDSTSDPDGDDPSTPTTTESPTPPPAPSGDAMALWDTSTGPHLRGANIWQARVDLELDGPDFKGPGPVGPPLTQDDFDRLSHLGANYVNVSHPGLFTETPPYVLDEEPRPVHRDAALRP